METEVLCQACLDKDTRKLESYLGQLSADAINRPNIKGIFMKRNSHSSIGETALLCATQSGATDCVIRLLNYDQLKQIDKQNKQLQTPLMNAASKGYCDIIALLLAMGADVSKKNRAGLTAKKLATHEALQVFSNFEEKVLESNYPIIHELKFIQMKAEKGKDSKKDKNKDKDKKEKEKEEKEKKEREKKEKEDKEKREKEEKEREKREKEEEKEREKREKEEKKEKEEKDKKDKKGTRDEKYHSMERIKGHHSEEKFHSVGKSKGKDDKYHSLEKSIASPRVIGVKIEGFSSALPPHEDDKLVSPHRPSRPSTTSYALRTESFENDGSSSTDTSTKSPRSLREDAQKSPRGDVLSPRERYDGMKRSESKGKLFGRTKDKIERKPSQDTEKDDKKKKDNFKSSKDDKKEEVLKKSSKDAKKDSKMKDGPKSARGKSKSKGAPKLAERKPVIWGITKIDNDNGEIGKRFVDSLIQWLESHDAHNSEGLFRRSGSESRLAALTALTADLAHKFYSYKFYGAFDLGDEMEEHNVATLLKRFFRDMKEPIIPFGLYGACIEAAEDHPSRLDFIRHTLQMLPAANLNILQILFPYLHRVHLNAAVNLMNSKNLAIVFSPNLLRSLDQDPLLMISNSARANTYVSLIIEKPELLWPKTSESERPQTGNEVKVLQEKFAKRKESVLTMRATKVQEDKEQEEYEIKAKAVMEMIRQGKEVAVDGIEDVDKVIENMTLAQANEILEKLAQEEAQLLLEKEQAEIIHAQQKAVEESISEDSDDSSSSTEKDKSESTQSNNNTNNRISPRNSTGSSTANSNKSPRTSSYSNKSPRHSYSSSASDQIKSVEPEATEEMKLAKEREEREAALQARINSFLKKDPALISPRTSDTRSTADLTQSDGSTTPIVSPVIIVSEPNQTTEEPHKIEPKSLSNSDTPDTSKPQPVVTLEEEVEPTKPVSEDRYWQCTVCRVENHITVMECDVCNNPQPEGV